MIAVGVIALLISCAMMGTQSFAYCRLANQYAANERGWREIASRNHPPDRAKFHADCVKYYSKLTGKYRRAMWRPWMPVVADPHAPGVDEWLEQERRTKEAGGDRSLPVSLSPQVR